MSTRLMFYNSYVRARLTYACQTWTLTAEQEKRLNSTHAQLLRRVVRGGRRQKNPASENDFSLMYSNAAIIERCKSSPLTVFINRQRVKCVAHLSRQPNSRHAKQLLFCSDKTRKSGNHTPTLLEQVCQIQGVDRDQFCRETRQRKF